MLMIESAPDRERGFFTSWQFSTASLGVALGASSAIILSSVLTPAQFESWGWRLPFLLGALIGPLGYFIRRNLEETIDISVAKADEDATTTHSDRVENTYIRQGLLGMLLIVGGITTSYLLGLYLPTFAIRQLGFAPTAGLSAGAIVGGVGFIVSPFVGLAADRYGRVRLVWWSRVALLLSTVPRLHMADRVAKPCQALSSGGRTRSSSRRPNDADHHDRRRDVSPSDPHDRHFRRLWDRRRPVRRFRTIHGDVADLRHGQSAGARVVPHRLPPCLLPCAALLHRSDG